MMEQTQVQDFDTSQEIPMPENEPAAPTEKLEEEIFEETIEMRECSEGKDVELPTPAIDNDDDSGIRTPERVEETIEETTTIEVRESGSGKESDDESLQAEGAEVSQENPIQENEENVTETMEEIVEETLEENFGTDLPVVQPTSEPMEVETQPVETSEPVDENVGETSEPVGENMGEGENFEETRVEETLEIEEGEENVDSVSSLEQNLRNNDIQGTVENEKAPEGSQMSSGEEMETESVEVVNESGSDWDPTKQGTDSEESEPSEPDTEKLKIAQEVSELKNRELSFTEGPVIVGEDTIFIVPDEGVLEEEKPKRRVVRKRKRTAKRKSTRRTKKRKTTNKKKRSTKKAKSTTRKTKKRTTSRKKKTTRKPVKKASKKKSAKKKTTKRTVKK